MKLVLAGRVDALPEHACFDKSELVGIVGLGQLVKLGEQCLINCRNLPVDLSQCPKLEVIGLAALAGTTLLQADVTASTEKAEDANVVFNWLTYVALASSPFVRIRQSEASPTTSAASSGTVVEEGVVGTAL